MGSDQEPIASGAYDALAERFAAQVETKPYNAYYDRPAVLSLLPEVRGKRVLDAGCGSGAYAERLANRGAEVVALDASEEMVRLAKERLGDKARVLRADLSRPLDFLQNASFDVVLSALALDYVEDWCVTFAEFRRVLRTGGCFVFSVEHPFTAFRRHGEGRYFDTELVSDEWRGFGGGPVRVPFYRRPMGTMVNALLETGFALERMVEPTPTEQFKETDPEGYEKLSRAPGFLCMQAVKR